MIALSALLAVSACLVNGPQAGAAALDRPGGVLLTEMASGRAAWASRAAGFSDRGTPDAAAAARAVAHFSAATAAAPSDLEARFALIEALYFQGHFVATERDEQRRLADLQLDHSQAALESVREKAGGARLARLPPVEQAQWLAEIEGARRACFWSAISWGVWAMSHGNLAAARRGAARHIRDDAELLIAIDERYADAGGLRLLGRLHTATPQVPLVTGWIDRHRGIALLERANTLSHDDARNPLFLAEALLRFAPQQRQRALALLRQAAGRPPRAEALVEESEIRDDALRRLAEESDEDSDGAR